MLIKLLFQVSSSQVNTELNKDVIIYNILNDIKETMLPKLELTQSDYQSRGVTGIWATLVAKYGKAYVTK